MTNAEKQVWWSAYGAAFAQRFADLIEIGTVPSVAREHAWSNAKQIADDAVVALRDRPHEAMIDNSDVK